MSFARIRKKGQLTLPAEVRKAANLENGNVVEVEVSEDGDIILRPKKLIPASQAWFWTQLWQEGEREASREREDGLGQVFRSDEALLASLEGERRRWLPTYQRLPRFGKDLERFSPEEPDRFAKR